MNKSRLEIQGDLQELLLRLRILVQQQRKLTESSLKRLESIKKDITNKDE